MTQAQSFIHRFEPGQSPDAPPLLLLHGTGGDEADLLPLGRAVAPGSALLSPRGKVLEGGMPRFFRRLREGVFDEEDVRARAHGGPGAQLAGVALISFHRSMRLEKLSGACRNTSLSA